MSALLEYWPMLLAAAGGLIAWVSRLQVKLAKAETEEVKGQLSVEREVQSHYKEQVEALKEGEKIAEKIIEEAHIPNSDGDLTRSDY